MLHNYPQLKAVFFDLDNVLVFSEITHFRAWQIALQEFNAHLCEADFEHMAGVSDLLQSEQFIEKFEINKDPLSLWESKKAIFRDIMKSGFLAPAGRNHFLETVSQTYITGVVSSSSDIVIEEILIQENIAQYFNFVISFQDCKQHKPHPYPYQLALSKSGCEPHQALVIEDSVSGITAAQRAQIPVIGIFKDQTPEKIIKGVPYFESFDTIANWLPLALA